MYSEDSVPFRKGGENRGRGGRKKGVEERKNGKRIRCWEGLERSGDMHE